MNNERLKYKIKQRLNKKDSKDFDNIDCLAITEAFNKYQLQWTLAAIRQGESSKEIVEELAPMLKKKEMKGTNLKTYFESESLPSDFLSVSKIIVKATKENCPTPATIRVTLVEPSNTDDYARDWVTAPSFEWRESYFTIEGDKIKVHTENDFTVTGIELHYYKYPREITLIGCEDEQGQPTSDTESEYGDRVIEKLIDGASSIIAGDIENFNQVQINSQRV
jgi:hypothetical protein